MQFGALFDEQYRFLPDYPYFDRQATIPPWLQWNSGLYSLNQKKVDDWGLLIPGRDEAKQSLGSISEQPGDLLYNMC